MEFEKFFQEEPLKSVDLSELKKQRSAEEVKRIMQFLVSKKHVLSDGKLDYLKNPSPQHSVTCEIRTTVDNPRIVSSSRSTSPADREEYEGMLREKLREGVIVAVHHGVVMLFW